MNIRKSLVLLAVLISPLMGCSVTAKFRPIGGSVRFVEQLPPPDGDDYLPGGLSLRIDSDILGDDDEFIAELGSAMIAGSEGRFKSIRGTGKKPQYVIVISEMTQDSDFEGSKLGAVLGAVGGGVAGHQSGHKTSRNTVLGAGAGAVGGYLLAGSKINRWGFQVDIQQHTSAAGMTELRGKNDNDTSSGGGMEDDLTGNDLGSQQINEETRKHKFDVSSNVWEQTRYFAVATEGGSMTGEGGAIDAVKQRILKRLPSWVFGGRTVF